MNGEIIRLYTEKGYGFIKGEDGFTYFLHASECRPRGIFDLMQEHQKLTFERRLTEDGLRAVDVKSDLLRAQLAG
jgi:cold shock CspA family protein